MAVQEENILAMTMNNRRKMPTTIKALECEVTNSVSFWVTFLVWVFCRKRTVLTAGHRNNQIPFKLTSLGWKGSLTRGVSRSVHPFIS